MNKKNIILIGLFILLSIILMLFINYIQNLLNINRLTSGITIFIIISTIFLIYTLILKDNQQIFKNTKILFFLIIYVL